MTVAPLESTFTRFEDELPPQLERLRVSRFSGYLEVCTTHGSSSVHWKFRFYLGRILYTVGGEHEHRAWQRLFSKHCPHIESTLLTQLASSGQSWQYDVLCTLFKQGLITRAQAVIVIQERLDEVLFDLLQAPGLSFCKIPDHNTNQEVQLALINTTEVLERAEKMRSIWQQAGLKGLSPNHSPVLRHPDLLREQTSEAVYYNLRHLLDGERTLRDLALQVKLDVLTLTRSFQSYIQRGILELIEIPDLPPPNGLAAVAQAPLIACIDDSPQICHLMEEILTGAGYQYLSILDPLRGFSTLLQRKPDLIFLDLVMPNTSGYEICSKLRKTATFQKTPVIILTGNDGFVDRVRSKLVGSSGFIGKPAKPELVLAVARKHLAKCLK